MFVCILQRLARHYIAEILPIRRKTLSNQSINQQRLAGTYGHFTIINAREFYRATPAVHVF